MVSVFALFALDAARGETLEEALAAAYQNNPQLLGARAGLRATDETVPAARANWRPSLTVSGTAGRETVSTTPAMSGNSSVQALPLSKSTSNSWTATVSQPIFRGGRTAAQLAEALLTVDAGRAQLEATEAGVLFQVASAYLGCLRDEVLLSLATESEGLLRDEFAAVEAQLKAAVATGPDKLQVEVQLANASATRVQAIGALQVSRDGYLRVVGHAPDHLSQPAIRPSIPVSRDEAVNLAATTSPTVVAAQAMRDAGAKAVGTVTGRLLPEVSLVGSYSRFSIPQIGGVSQGKLADRTIEVQVTLPLYDGGAAYAEARQSKQSLEQLHQAADDARAAAVQQTEQAWDTLKAARAALPELTHAVDVAQQAYEGVRQQQVLGRKTVTDVLIAEQMLIQTRSARTIALYSVAIAEFALAEQIGTLTAADLKLPVPLYDATEHFRQVQYKWLGLGSSVHRDGEKPAEPVPPLP